VLPVGETKLIRYVTIAISPSNRDANVEDFLEGEVYAAIKDGPRSRKKVMD